MSKVKQYLFSIPPGKEGSFCNMLTSYKSLAYLVSSVNEEECRAFVEFSRPTSIPQKKLKDIKVLEVLSTKQENIDHVKELGEPWMEMNFTTKKNSPKNILFKETMAYPLLVCFSSEYPYVCVTSVSFSTNMTFFNEPSAAKSIALNTLFLGV